MRIIKTASFEIAANVSGDKTSKQVAILMPGRLDTKDYANFVSHSEFLSKRGFLVVAIDPPGTWDSPGDLNIYSTSNYIKTINELIAQLDNRPTLLLGHSRGGATAMLASSNPAVRGIVCVNSSYGQPTPPKPKKVNDGVLVEYRDLPPGNERTEEKRQFDLPMAYFDDAKTQDPTNALHKFKGPKLLAHAEHDEFTPLVRVKVIYNSLNEPKMFLKLNGTHDYRLFPNDIEAVNAKVNSLLEEWF